MALSINTNLGAIGAAAAATSVNKSMESAMSRLSTGLRINTAADDAAGVAIASRLTAEIRGTNQAIRNAMDAQALIDTAEGAHNEIVNILQRMRELSVQGANDTNDATDRTALQAEMDALATEIDRVAANTTWAGKVLLNGAGSLGTVHGTADTHVDFNFHVGAGQVGAADTITARIMGMDAASLSVKSAQVPTVTDVTNGAAMTLTLATSGSNKTLTVGTYTAGNTLSFKLEGTTISVTEATATTGYLATADGVAAQITQAIKDAGISGVTATSSGAVVTIAKSGAVSVASNTAAQTSIGLIDAALEDVNEQRANLGAISNRLDSTVSNLTNISTNLEAGRSRIQDADFAAESTNMAKAQILQQASMAMLAQANASKQGVLQLLQR
jgi:flagellin